MHSPSSYKPCVFLPSHLVYSQPLCPIYSTACTSQAGAMVHCPHLQMKEEPSVADITGLGNSPAGLPAHHQPDCHSGMSLPWSLSDRDPEEGIRVLRSGLFLHPMPAFTPQRSQLFPLNACVSSPSTPLDTQSCPGYQFTLP